MAHELEVKDGKASMAYAGDKPWHGLGTQVPNTLLPKEILKEAGLNWKVNTVEMVNPKDHKKSMEPKVFALLRSTDNKDYGTCSSSFKPVQNEEAFDFFHKFVKAGKMSMETAGSLHDGKLIWGLARMKSADFALAKDDKVESYLLLSNQHKPGKAFSILFTPIRVVCNNTLTMALRGVDSKTSGIFRMTHHKLFDTEMKVLAEDALGLSSEMMKDFKEKASYLSKKHATDPKVNEYLIRLFGDETMKSADDFSPRISKMKDIYHNQPGFDKSPDTWWQAFNAVTYWCDHEAGRTADARLSKSWFGKNKGRKIQALNMALEYAKLSTGA